MKAYLDNNILVYIEQGHITLSQVIEQIDPKIESVFFSASHIQEMEEITGSTEEEKLKRINRRLKTIEEVTLNNYLYQNMENEVFFLKETPTSVLETIREVPTGDIMKTFLSLVTEDQKLQFREMLGINPKRINNYSSSEVITQLNTKLTNWGMNQSFMEMIEHGISFNPQSSSFGLNHRVTAIFEMLDMVGYWKDKVTKSSNYARFWDSGHAFFAAYCDYFISDDKRTRNKARVVYHQFNIGTKVLSSSGAE